MCVQDTVGFVEAECSLDLGAAKDGDVWGEDSDDVALVSVDFYVDVAFG